MSSESATMTLLQRREIEARIMAPFVREVMATMGEEATLAMLRKVIVGLAREAGTAMAEEFGDASLAAFARGVERWQEGEALELTVLAQTPDRLDFDVTRCRYAEMYRDLGMADLGGVMSCARDFALIEGFNPEVTLTRSQTILEGASHCDFRFRAKSE